MVRRRGGCGKRDMAVLPYRDRIEVFSRYLQQLVMESLGKRLDRVGNVVHQELPFMATKVRQINTLMSSSYAMASITSSSRSSKP